MLHCPKACDWTDIVLPLIIAAGSMAMDYLAHDLSGSIVVTQPSGQHINTSQPTASGSPYFIFYNVIDMQGGEASQAERQVCV